MNFGGDLEVILVKKRGVKNYKLLSCKLTDKVDGWTKERIDVKNRAKGYSTFDGHRRMWYYF
jgi:hypothetical protein